MIGVSIVPSCSSIAEPSSKEQETIFSLSPRTGMFALWVAKTNCILPFNFRISLITSSYMCLRSSKSSSGWSIMRISLSFWAKTGLMQRPSGQRECFERGVSLIPVDFIVTLSFTLNSQQLIQNAPINDHKTDGMQNWQFATTCPSQPINLNKIGKVLYNINIGGFTNVCSPENRLDPPSI